MQYLDLALSSVLFVLGVLSLVLRRLKTNLWISALALLLLPIAVYSYYFTDYDRLLFGKITVQTVLRFPFVKVLLVFALAESISSKRLAISVCTMKFDNAWAGPSCIWRERRWRSAS